MSKIDAIEAKLQDDLNKSEFYNAHQKARTIVRLLIRDANWPRAIEVLYSIAQAMLKAGQGGSGGDLAVNLVDIYKRAGLAPDATSKGRLFTLLRLFTPSEPTRKKFINETISWSSKYGEYPAGDPELHHVSGSLYAEELNIPAAESHLVIGTKDSSEVLTRLHYNWYKQNDAHMAPQFCARSVLPYLLMGNLRAANTSYRLFTALITTDNTNLATNDVNSNSCELRVFPSLPLLNFLGMLLLSTQRGSPDLFQTLRHQYASDIESADWDDVLDVIAEMYFKIRKSRPVNLMDMMGSMFGGAPPRPAGRGLAGDGLD